MKITNKLNLPEVFVKLATSDKEYKDHRYSVTELLMPTREIILNRKYAHEIETDVADTIPALFGTAIHKIFEEAEPENAEVKLETVINGEDTIVGIIDKIRDDAIEDYKTCSVSKVMKQDFDDWKLQGFIYAWMWFLKTGEIKRVFRNRALMKDWSKIKAAMSSDYPKSPIYTYECRIEDSDYDFAERYVHDKLKDIHRAELINLPECTDSERWYTGTKYAVYKKVGDARAAYVADTEEDAHNYITNRCNGAGEIQVRKGEYLKCNYYCSCNKFCNQYKKGE